MSNEFITELKSYLTDVTWTPVIERKVEGIYRKHLPVKTDPIPDAPVIINPMRNVVNKEEAIEWVMSTICEKMNVKRALLVSPYRGREYCLARQLAMYFLRNLYNMSYREIGEVFGDRDHTTTIHSCRVISDGIAVKDVRYEYFIMLNKELEKKDIF
jgi:Bacterial dnaA protein helix-turn-helix